MKKKSNATYRVTVGQATTELSRDEFVKFVKALAVALGIVEEDQAKKFTVVSSPSDANRAKLVKILEANDWNIARVSRELGITRRTLYMRMAAFEIERKKVPRLTKPI